MKDPFFLPLFILNIFFPRPQVEEKYGGSAYGYAERWAEILSELQKKIVETRVRLEGYSQTPVHGILAEKRRVICGTDPEDSDGCDTKWFTLEVLKYFPNESQ
jgi:hypothetical protein